MRRGAFCATEMSKNLVSNARTPSLMDVKRSVPAPQSTVSPCTVLSMSPSPRNHLRWVLHWLQSGSNKVVRDEDGETAGKQSVMTIEVLRRKWREVARELPKEWEVQSQSLDSALEGALSIR